MKDRRRSIVRSRLERGTDLALAWRLYRAEVPIAGTSNRNPLDFIKRNLIAAAVIQLRRVRRFVIGDLLRDFEATAVLHVGP